MEVTDLHHLAIDENSFNRYKSKYESNQSIPREAALAISLDESESVDLNPDEVQFNENILESSTSVQLTVGDDGAEPTLDVQLSSVPRNECDVMESTSSECLDGAASVDQTREEVMMLPAPNDGNVSKEKVATEIMDGTFQLELSPLHTFRSQNLRLG
jgi:hypothetical protein